MPILNSWGRGAWKVTISGLTRVGHDSATRNSKIVKQSERVLSSPVSLPLLSAMLWAWRWLACPQCNCSTACLPPVREQSHLPVVAARDHAAAERLPETKGSCSGGCVMLSLSGFNYLLPQQSCVMTSHKTSVVYTNKCLLLPKSPGAPADLDQPRLALARPIIICCQLRVEGTVPVYLWARSSSGMTGGACS